LANNLLVDTHDGKKKPLTAKEMAELLRIRHLAREIKTGEYRKCLK